MPPVAQVLHQRDRLSRPAGRKLHPLPNRDGLRRPSRRRVANRCSSCRRNFYRQGRVGVDRLGNLDCSGFSSLVGRRCSFRREYLLTGLQLADRFGRFAEPPAVRILADDVLVGGYRSFLVRIIAETRGHPGVNIGCGQQSVIAVAAGGTSPVNGLKRVRDQLVLLHAQFRCGHGIEVGKQHLSALPAFLRQVARRFCVQL